MAVAVESEPEEILEKSLAGLKRASTELGAAALVVLVAEGCYVEVAYPPAAPIVVGAELRDGLIGASGAIPAGTALAALLAAEVTVGAISFLLFPWRMQRRVVTIVFGFAENRPPLDSVPPHIAEKINLTALAAWSAKEIARLRAELRAVNRQFAGRKLVERAKGILQTEHGMSEQQAYEYLRKMSRQRRIAMAKLAEDLVGSGGLKSAPGETTPR
ncbi:MAG TPA: ANTAR domain-containing protein [Bryobacteraceae bacterium]